MTRLEQLSMVLKEKLDIVLSNHSNVITNPERKKMIQEAVNNKEVMVSKSGALASWTPSDSTGRSPKDTVFVRREESMGNIDWLSPNNLPLNEEVFELVFEDALKFLQEKEKIYITDRAIGADPKYALKVKTITSQALTSLFTDNMFRPVPDGIEKSIFLGKDFTLITLPGDKLCQEKYAFKLRKLPNGKTTDMIVAIDFDLRLGIVIGSSYLGSVKKLMFTAMNYYLPMEGVLPLHCSANEGKSGEVALLLGLSGTGKTTLSADPNRALLGDDEHGWSDDGIYNFENGCYAKMIDITEEKEPEIYNAVLHHDHYENHGAIVENAMIYPNGNFDFFDDRFTPNSRASYPLYYLQNIKEPPIASNPKTILFLTADAYGVLPPISKLNPFQARLWFLMGYTSKLAGTETGVTEPQTTFSRFFGAPFMPGNPEVYSRMLGEKLERFKTTVYLINTGWSGGKFGVGKRINLKYTRAMVDAAMRGDLEHVDYIEDTLFHLSIPKSCPGVPDEILNPVNTWKDKDEYHKTAQFLAKKFSDQFDDAYGKKGIKEEVKRQCPGK